MGSAVGMGVCYWFIGRGAIASEGLGRGVVVAVAVSDSSIMGALVHTLQ